MTTRRVQLRDIPEDVLCQTLAFLPVTELLANLTRVTRWMGILLQQPDAWPPVLDLSGLRFSSATWTTADVLHIVRACMARRHFTGVNILCVRITW